MPRDTRRADRVAAAIREEVASHLAAGVRDPRITGLVTVTGVDLTPDLRRARVYVSIMTGEDDRSAAGTTLEALNGLGHQLKGQIGRALRLRLAPELEFRLDETIARASRIESLLAQIKSDDEKRDD
ncbi:MAG TPA: 30S ribosome-binding factor RbfA [Gemmatimonadaceae bacterium]|jgi:ribosome-binding factor A|nr:30S ribosome-binding factor RbfA [Gemmatimonadaceae bacterium]